VPLRDLISENGLAAPYGLSVGQKLRLPAMRMHTVAAGDTLYSISRAYSVDLNSLARENNIAAPYGLSVGQKLRLPAAVQGSGMPADSARAAATALAPAAAAGNIGEAAKPAAAGTSSAPKAAAVPPAPPKKISSTTAGGRVAKLSAAPARAGTKFSWPVRGKIISEFGAKKNGLYNDGINIAAAAGTAVRAAENGVVAYAGNELKGMGNLVIIQHTGGWMTVYAHMDSMHVKRGAKISVGDKVGAVGKTGKVSEPQLHFEIRKGTKAYNPTKQMKA
jgi:murein DD-endopeptidase MepM/ murein hydrolase activator NlpD